MGRCWLTLALWLVLTGCTTVAPVAQVPTPPVTPEPPPKPKPLLLTQLGPALVPGSRTILELPPNGTEKFHIAPLIIDPTVRQRPPIYRVTVTPRPYPKTKPGEPPYPAPTFQARSYRLDSLIDVTDQFDPTPLADSEVTLSADIESSLETSPGGELIVIEVTNPGPFPLNVTLKITKI